MSTDNYLRSILAREAVDTGLVSPVRGVQSTLGPLIRDWSGDSLMSVSPSGSFAKGTANRSGTDIDLFISLSSTLNATLKAIYESLFSWVQSKGFAATRQNVSIRVRVGSYDVDLVPAKRQDYVGDDHSLYRRKAGTWTKTNVTTHIKHVVNSGRQQEARLVKLWRDQKLLAFPSFYLELTVINALSGQYFGSLSNNMLRILEYLRDSFVNARILDPANTNNVISDDLTIAEKQTVRAAALRALSGNWGDFVK